MQRLKGHDAGPKEPRFCRKMQSYRAMGYETIRSARAARRCRLRNPSATLPRTQVFSILRTDARWFTFLKNAIENCLRRCMKRRNIRNDATMKRLACIRTSPRRSLMLRSHRQSRIVRPPDSARRNPLRTRQIYL